MRITILGKRWNLRFLPKHPRRDHFGRCDAPHLRGKTIVVESGHSDEKTLEIVLHELLHAGAWNLSEETVQHWACDVASILTKLGFRR